MKCPRKCKYNTEEWERGFECMFSIEELSGEASICCPEREIRILREMLREMTKAVVQDAALFGYDIKKVTRYYRKQARLKIDGK